MPSMETMTMVTTATTTTTTKYTSKLGQDMEIIELLSDDDENSDHEGDNLEERRTSQHTGQSIPSTVSSNALVKSAEPVMTTTRRISQDSFENIMTCQVSDGDEEIVEKEVDNRPGRSGDENCIPCASASVDSWKNAAVSALETTTAATKETSSNPSRDLPCQIDCAEEESSDSGNESEHTLPGLTSSEAPLVSRVSSSDGGEDDMDCDEASDSEKNDQVDKSGGQIEKDGGHDQQAPHHVTTGSWTKALFDACKEDYVKLAQHLVEQSKDDRVQMAWLESMAHRILQEIVLVETGSGVNGGNGSNASSAGIENKFSLPYTKNFHAEVGEAAFQIFDSLIDPEASEATKTKRTTLFGSQLGSRLEEACGPIAKSGRLFCPEWRLMYQVPDDLLLLCLDRRKITRADVPSLRNVADEFGLWNLLPEVLDDLGLDTSEYFRELYFRTKEDGWRPTRSKTDLTCWLFVCRTYRCIKALQWTNIRGTLASKVLRCLQILQDHSQKAKEVSTLPPPPAPLPVNEVSRSSQQREPVKVARRESNKKDATVESTIASSRSRNDAMRRYKRLKFGPLAANLPSSSSTGSQVKPMSVTIRLSGYKCAASSTSNNSDGSCRGALGSSAPIAGVDDKGGKVLDTKEDSMSGDTKPAADDSEFLEQRSRDLQSEVDEVLFGDSESNNDSPVPRLSRYTYNDYEQMVDYEASIEYESLSLKTPQLLALPVEKLCPISGQVVQTFATGEEAFKSITGAKSGYPLAIALLGRNCYRAAPHMYHRYFWRLKGSTRQPTEACLKYSCKGKNRIASARALAASSRDSASQQEARDSIARDNKESDDDSDAEFEYLDGTDAQNLTIEQKSLRFPKSKLRKIEVERLCMETGKVLQTFANYEAAHLSMGDAPSHKRFLYALQAQGKARSIPHMFRGWFWRFKGSDRTPQNTNRKQPDETPSPPRNNKRKFADVNDEDGQASEN